MAIQEILSEDVQTRNSHERGINKNATGLMMDIAQVNQYRYPIESTVRELNNNAIDSVSEKLRAIDILSGKAKVSDFFVNERSEDLYQDSKWDASYYNTDYFSDNNTVRLTYFDNEGVGRCNTFEVHDEGVGVGMQRLFGILEVGYSTKRLRKDALGAWGVGAKVGLSTEAPYYTITTAHNGILYKVRVYNRKYQSLIGPFNIDTGLDNFPISNQNDPSEVIYGEPYEGKNFYKIEVPVLKSSKQAFIDAVKKQLLYMKDVTFHVVDQYGSKEIDFLAPTFYNSANIILSDNNYYSKPHVVVVKGDMESEIGVCYGFLDFEQMEASPIHGNIGIKCPIRQVTVDEDGNEVVINEGVSVTTSRESLIYDSSTIAFINAQFAKAKDEATEIVEKSLDTTDFHEWIKACRSMTSLSDSNKVLSRLKKICDLDDMTPTFKGESSHPIMYNQIASIFFAGYTITKHTKNRIDGRRQVKRERASNWNEIDLTKLYLKDADTSRIKELYMLDTIGDFCTISVNEDKIKIEDLGIKSGTLTFKQADKKLAEANDRHVAIWDLLDKKSYAEVEVPEDYTEEEKKEEAAAAYRELSPEELRKQNGKTVCRILKPHHNPNYDKKSYAYNKDEPYLAFLKDYTGKLYYCTEQEEEILHFVGHFVDRRVNGSQDIIQRAWNEDLSLTLVAKNNLKYFKHGTPISEFLVKQTLIKDSEGKLTGGYKMTTDMNVVQWNTARQIKPILNSIPFMRNFSLFDEDMFKLYKELKDYVELNYSDLEYYMKMGRFGPAGLFTGYLELLDKAQIVQTMVRDGATVEEINERISPDQPNGLVDAFVVEQPLLDKAEKLIAWANTYKDMLNNHYKLTTEGQSFTDAEEYAIKEYIQLKN
jgi:hypothetical protein